MMPRTWVARVASEMSDLASVDYNIHTVFSGFDILLMAYLVHKSQFIPRAIGVLLAIDGLAYLVYSFAAILAPGFATQPREWRCA